MNNTLRYIIIAAALWLVIAYLSKSDEVKDESGTGGNGLPELDGTPNSSENKAPETYDRVYKSQVVR